jgi:LPS sulfotransferase NodH
MQSKVFGAWRGAARHVPRAVGTLFGSAVAERTGEALRGLDANIKFLRCYSRGLGSYTPPNRFIILGLMRSGSTIFGDLLGQHPDITWLGEHYIQQAYHPLLYLRGTARQAPTSGVGVKIFSFEFAKRMQVPATSFARADVDRGRGMLKRLRDSGWKFIHLERTDIFAQAVSFTRAMQSGQWHRTEPSAAGRKSSVRLDLREFEQYLNSFLTFRRYEQDLFPGFEMLRLVYESDLQSAEARDQSTARAFAFLGLPPAATSSSYVKIADSPLDSQVENYDEVARMAQRSGVTPTR